MNLDDLKLTSLTVDQLLTFQGWTGAWYCMLCKQEFRGIIPYSAIIFKHPGYDAPRTNRAISLTYCAPCIENMGMSVTQSFEPAHQMIEAFNVNGKSAPVQKKTRRIPAARTIPPKTKKGSD